MKWARKAAAVVAVGMATSLAFAAPGPVAQAATPSQIGRTTTLNASYWSLRTAPASSRKCSTESAANSKASGTKLTLSVTKVTSGPDYDLITSRGADCKYGKFANGSLGTAGTITMAAGKVEAKIKFPSSQGMHGSVWLKSLTTEGEIDMIESYGHGYGLSSGVYTPAKHQAYVAVKASRKLSWWKKAHTYSVSWGPGTTKKTKGKIVYKFKIDGKKSRSDYVSSALKGQQFELVASLLTSDWELKQLNNPVKRRGAKGVKKGTVPATMTVSWVRVTPTA